MIVLVYLRTIGTRPSAACRHIVFFVMLVIVYTVSKYGELNSSGGNKNTFHRQGDITTSEVMGGSPAERGGLISSNTLFSNNQIVAARYYTKENVEMRYCWTKTTIQIWFQTLEHHHQY